MTEMMLKVTCAKAELPAALGDLDGAIDREIRLFLNGENDGSELLHGLYDDVLDEPVPSRLTDILRR